MVLEQISPADCGRDPCSQRSQLQHPPLRCQNLAMCTQYTPSLKKRKGEVFLSQLWTRGIAEGAGSSVFWRWGKIRGGGK